MDAEDKKFQRELFALAILHALVSATKNQNTLPVMPKIAVDLADSLLHELDPKRKMQ